MGLVIVKAWITSHDSQGDSALSMFFYTPLRLTLYEKPFSKSL